MGQTIIVNDKKFRKFISSARIQMAIAQIAKDLNKEYKNKRPIFISVLNGSFMFTADLLKKINTDCEISFIKISSYAGTRSSGKINELIGLNESLKGRHVIILEDIVDSGKTIEKVLKRLKGQRPKSLKTATLFFKPGAFQGNRRPDYVGLELPDDFIVGYGLDYNGLGRNLEDVYVLNL